MSVIRVTIPTPPPIGVSVLPSPALTRMAADALYVNIGGDAMAGPLILADGSAAASQNYVLNRTPRITPGTTPPPNPAVNDVWIDTN